jgi:hypothetical protein
MAFLKIKKSNMAYTVGKLKQLLENLPDDMEIGDSGHFGEFLECYDINVGFVFLSQNTTQKKRILSITIESPGEEPE